MNHVPEAVDLAPAMLRLQWPDGATELPAAQLRAACRCGGCRAQAQRGEAPPAAAELVDAVPVGSYALNLVFSDGHDRGIYPWEWLRELSDANGEMQKADSEKKNAPDLSRSGAHSIFRIW